MRVSIPVHVFLNFSGTAQNWMAIVVPLKLRKTCPGMEIRIAVCKNIKKGYSVVTLFLQWYEINSDISIDNKNE